MKTEKQTDKQHTFSGNPEWAKASAPDTRTHRYIAVNKAEFVAAQTAAQTKDAKQELHEAMAEYQKTGGGALSIPEAIRELATKATQADKLAEALRALYEHCAMVHKHWGDGCNQAEADAAINGGKAALADYESEVQR